VLLLPGRIGRRSLLLLLPGRIGRRALLLLLPWRGDARRLLLLLLPWLSPSRGSALEAHGPFAKPIQHVGRHVTADCSWCLGPPHTVGLLLLLLGVRLLLLGVRLLLLLLGALLLLELLELLPPG
jgi:hypothetical protein